ncbi:MAG: hypothetical protein B6D46_09800 [Polyangiaceae bacterium UTPRO1]|nr:MAG: hypothetical protein B6D46_09800 [Polyangiaceae bacterium UTPRO1]
MAPAIDQSSHRSDRGSQYPSADLHDLSTELGVRQSMGRAGVCWDNALAESFFATYKIEMIDRASLRRS